MMILLGILPILVLLFLLLAMRWSIIWSSAAAFVIAVGISVFVWQIDIPVLGFAVSRAVFLALEISLIIAGAMLFLREQEHRGWIIQLEDWLARQSRDERVQLIMMTWFFGSFLEGIAGFGIPALIVAPLLVHLGYKPLLAIMAALFANTTAVIFGAAGTPFTVGLAAFSDFFAPLQAVQIASIAGFWVPSLLVLMMASAGQLKYPIRYVREVLPFTLLAGGSFVLGQAIGVVVLGYELASIFAAVFGMACGVLALQLPMFQPKVIRSLRSSSRANTSSSSFHSYMFVVPYALFVLIFVTLRAIAPVIETQVFSQSLKISLANPGLSFLITILLSRLVLSGKNIKTQEYEVSVWTRIKKVSLSILFLSAMTQVMIGSANNAADFPSMLSIGFVNTSSPLYPVIAPLLGALGAFVAGSVTLSTILFAPIQAAAAQAIGMSVASMLAIQIVGATAGNMIALSNIVAVRSVVSVSEHEGEIVRKLLPWFASYLWIIVLGVLLIFFT